MANTLTQVGIETGDAVEAYHVTQSIDAFTGTVAYDISLSGSFNMTGSINGQPGVVNPLTASFAITASHALNITSSPIQTTGSTLYSTNPSTTNFSTNNSIFLGASTGNNSTNAIYSHFIGQTAGADATNSSYSNFIGQSAGQAATNASQSNFLGGGAGQIATNANNSNFFGNNTGNRASNASYSTLIGYQVGQSGSWGNIGSNNIIIGTNISLPNTRNNSINLGGVIFATGSYSLTTGNIYTGSQANSRVGIAKDLPNSTLDINGNTTISGSLTVSGSISGSAGVINPLTASYAITASHVPNTFVQNGNSFGTTARLGTNDSQPIIFETNNLQRMNISSTGTVGIGNGGNGTLFNILNGTKPTSGSESSNLLSFSTLTGASYTVHAYVTGYGGADGNIGGDIIGAFQNNSGTVTSAGSPVVNIIENFSGAPEFTLTTSGTNIILQITGQSATTINWAGHMKYIQYDANA
jgi:hypothetical protein